MGWIEKLEALDACEPALDWCRTQPSFESAWATCDRGDWLLWVAARLGVDCKLVVRAACACAREALQYVPAGEDRPRVAIETAEAWTRDEATIEQVRAAARAAAYAAFAYDDAAYAAAAAADAAYAAYAAAAAAYAAAAAHAAHAAKVGLRRSAEIVRSLIECPKL